MLLIVLAQWPQNFELPTSDEYALSPVNYNYIFTLSTLSRNGDTPAEICHLQQMLPHNLNEILPSHNNIDGFVGIHCFDLKPLLFGWNSELTFDTFIVLVQSVLETVDNHLNFKTSEQIVSFLSSYLPNILNVVDADANHQEINVSLRLKVKDGTVLNKSHALIRLRIILKNSPLTALDDLDAEQRKCRVLNVYRNSENSLEVYTC